MTSGGQTPKSHVLKSKKDSQKMKETAGTDNSREYGVFVFDPRTEKKKMQWRNWPNLTHLQLEAT